MSLFTRMEAVTGIQALAGYAAILMKGRWKKEIVGSITHSTNNRMELQAVISGLLAIKSGSHVTVFSDSKYVVDAVNSGRLIEWQANGWRRIRTMEPVKNSDLWRYYHYSHRLRKQ